MSTDSKVKTEDLLPPEPEFPDFTPIRITLPSGYILEMPPEHERKSLADLRGKVKFADGYDPKAPYLATEEGAKRALRDAQKALAIHRAKKRSAGPKALRKSPVLADE